MNPSEGLILQKLTTIIKRKRTWGKIELLTIIGNLLPEDLPTSTTPRVITPIKRKPVFTPKVILRRTGYLDETADERISDWLSILDSAAPIEAHSLRKHIIGDFTPGKEA